MNENFFRKAGNNMNMRVFISPPCSFSNESMLRERKALGKLLTYRENKLVTLTENDYLISCFKERNLQVNVISTDSKKNSNSTPKDSFQKILEESDVLVFLPGTFQSTNLLFTAINNAYEGTLDTPVIILNSNHFFDEFIFMVNKSLGLTNNIVNTVSETIFDSVSISSHGVYEVKSIDDALCLIEKLSEYTPFADVAKVGEYVNYPVAYENVTLENGQVSAMCGWRVIKKYHDYVYLISAGTPLALSFSKEDDTNEGHDKIRALLKWDMDSAPFTANGFINQSSVTKAFVNRYTLDINIAVAEDFESVLGATISPNISNLPKKDLLLNGTNLYLLSWYDQLCLLEQDGKFSPHKYGSFGVRPIVTLKPNILTKGKDENGIWQLA